MKVSFFETVRYLPPQALPPEWPVPSGAYDPEAGTRAYREMIERLAYVEELGFDCTRCSPGGAMCSSCSRSTLGRPPTPWRGRRGSSASSASI